MNTILVVNAGSSSVKFQLYAADGSGRVGRLIKGSIDGVGTQPRLRGEGADGKSLIDREQGTLSADRRTQCRLLDLRQCCMPAIFPMSRPKRQSARRSRPARAERARR
jgi:hypothetical protein